MYILQIHAPYIVIFDSRGYELPSYYLPHFLQYSLDELCAAMYGFILL